MSDATPSAPSAEAKADAPKSEPASPAADAAAVDVKSTDTVATDGKKVDEANLPEEVHKEADRESDGDAGVDQELGAVIAGRHRAASGPGRRR